MFPFLSKADLNRIESFKYQLFKKKERKHQLKGSRECWRLISVKPQVSLVTVVQIITAFESRFELESHYSAVPALFLLRLSRSPLRKLCLLGFKWKSVSSPTLIDHGPPTEIRGFPANLSFWLETSAFLSVGTKTLLEVLTSSIRMPRSASNAAFC